MDSGNGDSGRQNQDLVLRFRHVGTTTLGEKAVMRAKIQLMRGHRKREDGMSLIELMIAMVVLAVGLGALTVLFISSASADNRNSRDTSATLLAQLVLEQISAQHPNSTASIILTYCAGTQWDIATAGSIGPTGTGATLVIDPTSQYYGAIDPTQAYAAVPPATAAVPGYAMQYVDCNTGGRQAVYDVRWNIINVSPYARMITVSSRQLSPSSQLGNRTFALPVTLRGLGGM